MGKQNGKVSRGRRGWRGLRGGRGGRGEEGKRAYLHSATNDSRREKCRKGYSSGLATAVYGQLTKEVDNRAMQSARGGAVVDGNVTLNGGGGWGC